MARGLWEGSSFVSQVRRGMLGKLLTCILVAQNQVRAIVMYMGDVTELY